MHTPDAQSPAAPQPTPSAQVGEHPGTWHTLPVHTPEPQSPGAPQATPSPQVGEHAGG